MICGQLDGLVIRSGPDQIPRTAADEFAHGVCRGRASFGDPHELRLARSIGIAVLAVISGGLVFRPADVRAGHGLFRGPPLRAGGGAGGAAEVAFGKRAVQEAKRDEEAIRPADGRRSQQGERRAEPNAGAKGMASPDMPTPAEQKAADQIAQRSGAAFDEGFLNQQALDHKKTIALFRRESRSGGDPELKKVRRFPVPEPHPRAQSRPVAAAHDRPLPSQATRRLFSVGFDGPRDQLADFHAVVRRGTQGADRRTDRRREGTECRVGHARVHLSNQPFQGGPARHGHYPLEEAS